VAQTSADATYLSRHAGLRCGLGEASTALTVNRLCGSGFQAAISAAHELAAGDNATGLALVGGAESMSQAPLSVWGQHARFGHRLGTDLSLVDTLWHALTDAYAKVPMGITAETLGARYGVTRAACDALALRSQTRWAAAHKAGALAAGLAPMSLPGKRGALEDFSADEHPRPASTLEALAKLPPVFKKDGGLVSAGNASGVCDGAAALLLATEAAVAAHGLTPLARLVGWVNVGVDPKVMGIGPAPAIRALLARAQLSLADVAHLEVNEAFAAQALAVAAELGVDPERLNAHGGAIALGHPLGASGARILGLLAHGLAADASARYAVGSACIGGGQGVAVLLERA
jgi:acetyl-CoA acyltransferase 2